MWLFKHLCVFVGMLINKCVRFCVFPCLRLCMFFVVCICVCFACVCVCFARLHKINDACRKVLVFACICVTWVYPWVCV